MQDRDGDDLLNSGCPAGDRSGGGRSGTGTVCDPFYREHQTSMGHPERPERYDAVLTGIAEARRKHRLADLRARDATESELRFCHTPEYIAAVREDVETGRFALRTGDTDICAASYDVAVRAAGGALAAVEAVLAGTVRNAFCALRPPGHHACANRGMGFCMFNNAALAARHAQRQGGLERILIADWDVHHGNGTQSIFYNDPSVFYFSAHQWPSYPGTGRAGETGSGAGRGTTLNCPQAVGAGRKEVMDAFEGKLRSAMQRFRPQFVIVSAGFDGEAGDPLGGFGLEPADFSNLTRCVVRIAGEYADGRLVSVLEGGYRLAGLAACTAAHLAALSATAATP